MLVQRAYKTELDLNDRQITACKQHAGVARWAYNWGLKVKQERYRATKRFPTAIDLHRELNALKKTQVPWMYQVSKCTPQEGLRNLDAAFANFFSAVCPQEARQVERKARLSPVQDQEEGIGQFPAHWADSGLGEGD